MKLSETETRILTGILSDYAAFEFGLTANPLGWPDEILKNERFDFAAGLGVKIRHQNWAEMDLSPADSRRFQRAIACLAKRGLLKRGACSGYSDRTTNVRLTKSGRELAEKLSKQTLHNS